MMLTALPAWPDIYAAAVKTAADTPLEKRSIDFAKLNPFRKPGAMEQLFSALRQNAPGLAEEFYNSNLRGHVENFAKDPATMMQAGLGKLRGATAPQPGQQPGMAGRAAGGAMDWLHQRLGQPDTQKWLQEFAAPLKSNRFQVPEQYAPHLQDMGYEMKPGASGSFDVTQPGLINQILHRLKGQNQQQ